ncbi:MAG: hypothetical protein AAFN77_09340 [Planctomycetota bacterium]
MKNFGLMVCVMIGSLIVANEANAQLRGRLGGFKAPIYNGLDAEMMTTTNDVGFVSPAKTFRNAAKNRFSPHRIYTYSNTGIRAGLTHQWNQQEAASQPWHDNYQYWRYGEPTALVVPPTAAYQTSYGWGVGQVRSYPIHHQYGRGSAGTMGGGAGMFSRTPYWPSHTDQMGVYSVRAPW